MPFRDFSLSERQIQNLGQLFLVLKNLHKTYTKFYNAEDTKVKKRVLNLNYFVYIL